MEYVLVSMNPLSKLFGSDQNTSEPKEEPTPEDSGTENASEADEDTEETEEEVAPAYDLSRRNKVRFEETVTINTEEKGDFATITVETIADSITFDVRISGYTSRFGELDVEYISGGGYAIDLYHPHPDSDNYFVRRLYYYADEGGIGTEQHSDGRDEPSNTLWERDSDFGSTVENQIQSTYLTVYDWRENMLISSDNPVPNGSEVVIQYNDSLRSGGGRKEVSNVFNTKEVETLTGETHTVQFISVDSKRGSYVLHSETEEGKSYLFYTPLDEPTALENFTVEKVSGLEDPSDVENVIWTRNPEDTWDIKGFNQSEESEE